MFEELLELLKDGTNRNIVVYDSAAEPGLLTAQLIDLLQQVSQENHLGEVVEVYARGSSLKEFDPSSINKHIMPYAIDDEVWNMVENHYKNVLGGCYANYDNNLVIVLSNTNKALLGSF